VGNIISEEREITALRANLYEIFKDVKSRSIKNYRLVFNENQHNINVPVFYEKTRAGIIYLLFANIKKNCLTKQITAEALKTKYKKVELYWIENGGLRVKGRIMSWKNIYSLAQPPPAKKIDKRKKSKENLNTLDTSTTSTSDESDRSQSANEQFSSQKSITSAFNDSNDNEFYQPDVQLSPQITSSIPSAENASNRSKTNQTNDVMEILDQDENLIRNGQQSWLDIDIFKTLFHSVDDVKIMLEESRPNEEIRSSSTDLITLSLQKSINNVYSSHISTDETIMLLHCFERRMNESCDFSTKLNQKYLNKSIVFIWHYVNHFFVAVCRLITDDDVKIVFLDSFNDKLVLQESHRKAVEVMEWAINTQRAQRGIGNINLLNPEVIKIRQQRMGSNNCGFHSAINSLVAAKFLNLIDETDQEFNTDMFAKFMNQENNLIAHNEADEIRSEYHLLSAKFLQLYKSFFEEKKKKRGREHDLEDSDHEDQQISKKRIIDREDVVQQSGINNTGMITALYNKFIIGNKRIIPGPTKKGSHLRYKTQYAGEEDEEFIANLPDESEDLRPLLLLIDENLNDEIIDDSIEIVEDFTRQLDSWRVKFMRNGIHINGKKSKDLLGDEIPHQQQFTASNRNIKKYLRKYKDEKYDCKTCNSAPVTRAQFNTHIKNQHNTRICIYISLRFDAIYVYKNAKYFMKFKNRLVPTDDDDEDDGKAFMVNIYYLNNLPDLVFDY